MQLIQSDHTADRRLRFVFSDRVMSFPLASDATFGDVARKLGEVLKRRRGNPVAVDVTLGAREGNSARPMSDPPAPSAAL